MDDDAILLAIGKLQGQMEGIGRELKAVKDMISEANAANQNCMEGIKDRVSYLELNGAKISQSNAAKLLILEGRVDKLEKKVNTETAVEVAQSHWIDSTLAKIGVVITFVLTIYNTVRGVFV